MLIALFASIVVGRLIWFAFRKCLRVRKEAIERKKCKPLCRFGGYITLAIFVIGLHVAAILIAISSQVSDDDYYFAWTLAFFIGTCVLELLVIELIVALIQYKLVKKAILTG